MDETEITVITPPSKWSTMGQALTMTALDTTNGNKFAAKNDILILVQNTDAGPHTFEITSQPYPPSNRTGNINQAVAAGELRIFRLTKTGWENSNGYVIIPPGQSNLLEVAIINMTD